MADRWSLGVLVGLPVAGVVTLILLGLAALLLYVWRSTEPGGWSDRGLFAGGFFTCLALALGVVIATGLLMWPWHAEYHRWTTVTGEVRTVSSRFLASDTQGGGSTQRFVVDLAGVGQRSCDDTRCSLVKPGDRLTLSCKREWQYTGTPGWSCAYVDDARG